MTPAEFLHTHEVFRRSELARALARKGGRAPATVTSHLQRWERTKRVLRLRRGLYVRASRDESAGSVSVDPLVLASRLADDAVLAYHTALEAHGCAQSLFHRFTVATWSRVRTLRFQALTFVPVRPRAGVGRGDDAFTMRMDRAGSEVRVTTVERTVVDVLDRPDLAGGVEEVWRSCGHVEALDFDALEDYALRVGRRVVFARLGFLLETHAERWMVPQALLERLRERGPRSPVYLDLDRRRRGRFVPRWNLVVPPELPPQKEASDAEDSP